MAEPVIVVSGLPRSGTSLMMTMLTQAGVRVVTDNERTADDDNPNGYFELERVKQLPKGDIAWLADAPGKAVKVISMLLRHLPATYRYKVLFMRRAMPEILASQRAMLARRGRPASAEGDAEMAAMFTKHLGEIEAWLEAQANIDTLYVNYNALVSDPAPEVRRIVRFLGGVDESAMMRAVDPDLYRNRAS
jgi:hypothetical protein